MGRRIVWSKLALNELKLIRAFIALESKFYANQTVTNIKLRTEVLLEFPEIGKYLLESQYRELIEGNYRIIYRYDKLNEEIRIVSVFHSSRDIDSLIVK